MSVMRTAYVYVRNIFAGTLCETDEGYSFFYDENYMQRDDASVVSLTLPLDQQMYYSKTLFSLHLKKRTDRSVSAIHDAQTFAGEYHWFN